MYWSGTNTRNFVWVRFSRPFDDDLDQAPPGVQAGPTLDAVVNLVGPSISRLNGREVVNVRREPVDNEAPSELPEPFRVRSGNHNLAEFHPISGGDQGVLPRAAMRSFMVRSESSWVRPIVAQPVITWSS